jgi:hypothetical protein
MASQHFVAFSDRIMGLGHYQAAPYGCSKSPNTNVCTTSPSGLSVDLMVDYLQESSDSGSIANATFLRSRPVWVQSGTRDSVVYPLVNEKAAELYRTFSDNVAFDAGAGAQHAFLTDGYGGCPVCNSCSALRTPFINDCDYDMPGAMFQHLYGGTLLPRVTPNNEHIVEIDQSLYFPPNTSDRDLGMNTRAFVYVPEGCRSNASSCSIHVMYHGCNSGVDSPVGTSIITYGGFNSWAESNNILVLYPQAYATNCWDWTGRVTPNRNTDYDTKDSLQANTVNRMVDGLRGDVERAAA